jgi:hypothetical protein
MDAHNDRHRLGPGLRSGFVSAGDGGSLIGAVEGDLDFFAGSVFRLTPPAAGGSAWTFAMVWDFDNGPDRNPLNVVTGLDDNLFGVLQGGDPTNGSLFELHGTRGGPFEGVGSSAKLRESFALVPARRPYRHPAQNIAGILGASGKLHARARGAYNL